MSEVNRQWLLAARPVGMVKESDFELRSSPVPLPGEGQILVRNRWLAFEPAMRGWMEDRPNYIPPVGIGEVMRGMTVGEVTESHLDGYAEAAAALQEWVADGSIAWKADVQKGFENAPATLRRLYTGANFGEQLLEL